MFDVYYLWIDCFIIFQLHAQNKMGPENDCVYYIICLAIYCFTQDTVLTLASNIHLFNFPCQLAAVVSCCAGCNLLLFFLWLLIDFFYNKWNKDGGHYKF
jgi:hypothetical protein